MEAAQEFCPTLVNCHALKDYFTAEMAEQFFTEVLAWQRENNYNVYHETHRKRFLHSPWVGRDFVPKFKDLKLVEIINSHQLIINIIFVNIMSIILSITICINFMKTHLGLEETLSPSSKT